MAFVRHNSTRSKDNYDKLAAQIEEAWREAIYGDVISEGKEKGKRKKEVDEIERDMLARKLLAVAFMPMLAVRELGTAMPEAGGEKGWFKDNLEYFKKMAEEKGDEDIEAMLVEVNKRDDLKHFKEDQGVSDTLSKMKLDDKDNDKK
jgi:hypothetical protein